MRGFSLIEMLIVTSITLAVAGLAIPKFVTTIANVELRSAVHSAAGVMQQTRMQAIKENKFRKIRYLNGTNGGVVFEDINDNGLADATEPQAQMGNTVLAYSAPIGIPAMSATDLSFTPTLTTAPSFNATGQPCSVWHTCAVGMVVYFTDTRTVGTPGWAAVTISPAGRVASWIWNGSSWSELL